MSSSETKVRVASADPFAEVSLVDAHYRVRASGLGSIEQSLAPGLYVARVRSGDVTRQQSLRITPGSSEKHEIHFGEVGPLRSSAPAAASSELTGVAQSVAQQGWVLLALSGMASADPPFSRSPLPSSAVQGFALCTLDGAVVQTFDAVSPTLTPTGHQAVAAAAAPGWYALAIPSQEGRRILLPLRVQARWSPSVFIEMRDDGDDGKERRPNLDTILVSYDPAEWAIYGNPNRLRAMEQARRALARGRGAATAEVMRILYEQKFQDPMLGLMAAALLLAVGEPSAQLGEVLEHTGNLLGHDHPDLVISRATARREGLVPNLKRRLGDRARLAAPPLLRASWERLLGLKDRRSELLDRDGPLYRVAGTQVKSEVWMLWWEAGAEERADEATVKPSTRAPARVSGGADALLAQLMEKWSGDVSTGPSALEAWYRQNLPTLAPVERSVVRACIQLAQVEPGRELPKGFASRLAQAAQVPLPVLKDALGHLIGRMS
jgi:hypothetical protein